MFTSDDYVNHYALKEQGLEAVLGLMHNLVGHAIVPFRVGGPVDVYRFPNAIDGTAFATMELIDPDGSGPQPSAIGTYELVAFTRLRIDDAAYSVFSAAELHVRSILTSVARYSLEAVLNPFDTCEVPGDSDDEPSVCLVFDEWKPDGKPFRIGQQEHGLLLCLEVFRSEMDFAMENGSGELIARLKRDGYYPFSEIDRPSVA